MNEEQLDRIDSYVLHKMDDAEVTAFEEEMSADESLASCLRSCNAGEKCRLFSRLLRKFCCLRK